MRTFNILQGLAPLLLTISCCAGRTSPNDIDKLCNQKRLFPNNFRFGAATAAYQVEGGWESGGKSKSIWDVYAHKPGKIKDNSSGNVACNSYELYECDSAMLRYLGVNFYRFSISWPRILPNGFANNISQEGIDHYNKVIDDLLKSEIDPVVTIYHWDLPQFLQDIGGWANPLIAQWIEDYARVLFENFGDRVKTWITINEPLVMISGYGSDEYAPGLKDGHGTVDYIVAKNILIAHARVWHLYDKEFRRTQQGSIGISLVTDYNQGLTDSPEDIQAGEDVMQFNTGMYSHPIFSSSGGFPPRVEQIVAEKSKEQGYPRSRLPEFTDEEREYCKGTSDFYGMNHYSTQFWTRSTYKPKIVPSKEDDIGATGSYLNYPKTASAHISVIPHGMRRALNWVKDNCNNPRIIITENGVATNEDLQDFRRIDYFKKYLSNVLDAMYEDKVDVVGYMAWSLMDNFEWNDGFEPKFGIFKVDHKAGNKTRQARLSAIWYRDLISSKTLDPDYIPTTEKAEFCTS
ncbi:myrosinase 1-like isoform X2 [Leguminivora glycinivorella]|nr:myrosinase 1-like isoform X2 [Leguminivora glycinivorella]XP_047994055.1 myrosinase 1-like isoform X2 [Leguminivora glycinivorella]